MNKQQSEYGPFATAFQLPLTLLPTIWLREVSTSSGFKSWVTLFSHIPVSHFLSSFTPQPARIGFCLLYATDICSFQDHQ